MADENIYVNTKKLCQILDISAQHVTRLVEKKVLKKISTGKWNLVENVQSFIKYQKKMVADEYSEKITEITKSKDDDPDYVLKMLKVRREELNLAKEVQEVILVEDVVAYLKNLAVTYKNAMAKIPKKFGKSIPDMNKRKEYQEELKIIIEQTNSEIRSANITKNLPTEVGDTQKDY